MKDLREIARRVADKAMTLAPALIADATLESVETKTEAAAAINAAVTQDPTSSSKRVWSAAFAIITAILAVPEVVALLGPWAPVVTAVVSAGLSGWSKAIDPRPER